MTFSAHASKFISSFDGAVDEFITTGRKFDAAALIARCKLKPAEIKEVQDSFEKKVEELELVVIDADEQLIEGYSNMSKQTQRDLLIAYHAVMEARSVKARKERKQSNIGEDGIIRSAAAPVVKEVHCFSAVYATCPAYNVIRSFVGNVKSVGGKKVTADQIFETKFEKTTDLSVISNMTQTEIEEFISTGTRHSHVPGSYVGKAVHTVVTF